MTMTTGVRGMIETVLSSPINVKGDLLPRINIIADLSTPINMNANLNMPKTVGTLPYNGDYVVIPNDEEQVLKTQGLAMRENVVVRPIPENYGKITWNGSILTVI